MVVSGRQQKKAPARRQHGRFARLRGRRYDEADAYSSEAVMERRSFVKAVAAATTRMWPEPARGL